MAWRAPVSPPHPPAQRPSDGRSYDACYQPPRPWLTVLNVAIAGLALGWRLEFYSTWRRLSPDNLEVRVVGSNPGANPKRHMFGLDYLLLEK